MKKKIRLFITALIVLITFLFINISKIKASTAINSYEEEQGLIVVGTYEKIEREEVLMKIQITEDMKEYYDEHNIPYITETRVLKLLFKIIHTYEYYYTYVSYYDDVVSEKYVLKNDIQSVIYLVQVLEDFANDYIEEKRSEMENPPEETDIIRNRSITNLILGYIRGINLAYCRNGYFNGLAWYVTAGEVDYDFVDYVNLHDSSPFKIRDYFARFVDQANYNSDDYGTITFTGPTLSLIDPLNNYTENNKIDLIHMIASIDGVYDFTDNFIIELPGHFQRDLSNWAGDLQKFIKHDICFPIEDEKTFYINNINDYSNTNDGSNYPIELKSFLDYNMIHGDNDEYCSYCNNLIESCTCTYNGNNISNEDMLTDIDAMNIVKLYLDAGNHYVFPFYNEGQEIVNDNLLSSCLIAYYNFCENDNSANNRYSLFIVSIASCDNSNLSDITKFANRVYYGCALVKNSDGTYSDVNYQNLHIMTYYFLDGTLNNTYKNFRIDAANLFIDYILEMSTPPIITYSDAIAIDCYSDTFEDYVSLGDDEIIRYPINVLCETTYKLKASSQLNEISIILYNEDGTIYNVLDLDVGSYYLELCFADESDGWDIEVEIGPYIQDNRREILFNQTTDVLKHMHDGISKYKFMRANGDYYNMQIIMESYDSEINPTCEVELINTYNNDIITYNLKDGEAQNNQYIYNIVFEADSLYMINIDFSSEDLLLSSCSATITYLDEISLDTLGTYEYEEDIVIGDKVNYWNVLQNSVYEITIEGSNLDDVLFVVLKKNGNNFINLYSELASGTYYLNTDFELNQGDEIYIGYLNGNGTGSYEFTIERAISNSFHLVTDIDNLHTVGSEVRLNNGSYGGTSIMQGFTRVCYLDIDCPYPNTRLDYNWYSSDESVAKVSTFGTVTATCLWQENVNSRQVTITAVYKYDYTVIGTIILTVYKDTSSINDITYLQYGMDVRDGGTISGTEVTSGLGSTISVTYNPTVTIHTNKTRLICLGLDSPTSSIQDYIWSSSNNYYAQVSSFGTIFANNSGIVTISGINKYNSRYRVNIIITII